ncbi:hypothetical protein HDU93_008719 [Gonapodya sp. JEL0774]|nr:hypothetical protein HDU93_008719 [Gonapodya sp. JEL0774]
MDIWSIYTSMSPTDRKVLLEGLLHQSCVPQLSYIAAELNTYLRIDYIATAPREIALKILTYLDATSLCHAAQVSRTWKRIADDDVIWHRMCEQHIDRKCPKCGWGLPLLDFSKYRKRRISIASQDATRCSMEEAAAAQELSGAGTDPQASVSRLGPAVDVSRNKRRRLKMNHPEDEGRPLPTAPASDESMGEQPDSRPLILNSSRPLPIPSPRSGRSAYPTAPPRNSGHPIVTASLTSHTSSVSPSSLSSSASSETLSPYSEVAPAHCTYFRAWKEIYAERLLVERNWRKGNYQFQTQPAYGEAMALDGGGGGGGALEPILTMQLDECQNILAVGGHSDGTVRLFTPGTPNPFLVLRGHAGPVRALKFDQNKLVSGSTDGTIRVWRHRTPGGDLAKILRGHLGPVTCLDFDDRLLVSGGCDNSIRAWNFGTGRGFTLSGHTDWVNGVKLCGNYVFSVSDDHTLRMWDLEKRACIRVMTGHVAPVQSVKVNPSVAAVQEQTDSSKNKSKALDNGLETQGTDTVLSSSSRSGSLAVKSASDRPIRVVTCSLDNTIKVWNPFTGQCLRTMFGHMEGVWCVAFDSLRIVSGAQDGKVEIWDTETGETLHTLGLGGTCKAGFGGRVMRRNASGDQRAAALQEADENSDSEDDDIGHASLAGPPTVPGQGNLAAIGLQVPAAMPLGQPQQQRSRCAITAVQLTDTKIIAGGSDGVVRVWDFGITLDLGIGLGKQDEEVEWEGRRSPERVESWNVEAMVL